jgi:hypothetical protein
MLKMALLRLSARSLTLIILPLNNLSLSLRRARTQFDDLRFYGIGEN